MRAPPRGRARAALCVVLLVAACPAAAPAADAEFATPHVLVRGDVGETAVRAYAELAEAAWPAWKAYFGAEPPARRRPLVLDVRTTREGFLHAVHRVGVQGALPGAGGYYDPGSRISFLYLQPHESSTRLLVLHEATHQYQYKAMQDDVPDRSPVWHKEGLAEHFGYHRRTATGVELGVLDMVAIDDRPAQVAARVKAGTFDAWAIAVGEKRDVDYADAMGLVETFLRTKDEGLRDAYRAWEKETYRAGNATSKFERRFAPLRVRLGAAVKEVWGGYVAPWKVGYIGWDEEPGAIVGRGTPWAILLGRPLRGTKRAVEATVVLGKDATAGGIGLGAKDAEHVLLAELRPDGTVSLRQRAEGRWAELGAAGTTPVLPPEGVSLRLEILGTTATVSVGGVPSLTVDLSAAGVELAALEGGAALVAQAGEVRFRQVRTTGE